MWSGNVGLAIRNLVKEKEKFIEEVRIQLRSIRIVILMKKIIYNFILRQ